MPRAAEGPWRLRSIATDIDDRFLFIKQPPRASVVVVLDWWSEAAAKLAASGR